MDLRPDPTVYRLSTLPVLSSSSILLCLRLTMPVFRRSARPSRLVNCPVSFAPLSVFRPGRSGRCRWPSSVFAFHASVLRPCWSATRRSAAAAAASEVPLPAPCRLSDELIRVRPSLAARGGRTDVRDRVFGFPLPSRTRPRPASALGSLESRCIAMVHQSCGTSRSGRQRGKEPPRREQGSGAVGELGRHEFAVPPHKRLGFGLDLSASRSLDQPRRSPRPKKRDGTWISSNRFLHSLLASAVLSLPHRRTSDLRDSTDDDGAQRRR